MTDYDNFLDAFLRAEYWIGKSTGTSMEVTIGKGKVFLRFDEQDGTLIEVTIKEVK